MPVATRTLDLSTRYFWRMVGRQIDIAGTDHWLKLGRWQALQLHYRLDRD